MSQTSAQLLNGGPLAGLRNAIINGNFDIWQRGTSFTGSEYGADRWIHNRSGTTHTVTRQPFTLGQTAYLAWLEAGNTPEPAPEPEPSVELTPSEKLAASGLTVEELKQLLGLK